MPPLAAAMNRESRLPRNEWPAPLQNPWSARAGSSAEPLGRTYLSFAAPSDPDSLRSVLAACGLLGIEASERAPGRSVRVLVLDEPVDQTLATDAASVLWWSASPAKWSRPVIVPVIIEE